MEKTLSGILGMEHIIAQIITREIQYSKFEIENEQTAKILVELDMQRRHLKSHK